MHSADNSLKNSWVETSVSHKVDSLERQCRAADGKWPCSQQPVEWWVGCNSQSQVLWRAVIITVPSGWNSLQIICGGVIDAPSTMLYHFSTQKSVRDFPFFLAEITLLGWEKEPKLGYFFFFEVCKFGVLCLLRWNLVSFSLFSLMMLFLCYCN